MCCELYRHSSRRGIFVSKSLLLFLFFITNIHMPQSVPRPSPSTSRVHQIRLSTPHAPQQHKHIPINNHIPYLLAELQQPPRFHVEDP
jgi:hypothetical protein